jgi:hypothetical protein
VKLMLSGDYIIAIIYITGSALGKWIATTKLFNYRNFILNQVKKK